MERTSIHWETAAAASKELSTTSERTLAHELTQTRNLETLLRPIFADQQAPSALFNPALWLRILRFSHVPLEGIDTKNVDALFKLAKDEYETLVRVVEPVAAGKTDVARVLRLTRGIDRGVRKHITATEFEKF